MNSIILRASSRLILPAALIFSIYILFRGHNEPGGGFIGGLIAAAGFAVHALPRGRESLLATLRYAPKAIIGMGFALGIVAGLPALLLGQPFLTHQWIFPGGLHLGTTIIFDIGVYLAVIGAVLTFLSYYLED